MAETFHSYPQSTRVNTLKKATAASLRIFLKSLLLPVLIQHDLRQTHVIGKAYLNRKKNSTKYSSTREWKINFRVGEPEWI
jgi:hypothetical protein